MSNKMNLEKKERIALILLEAFVSGNYGETAKKHGISTKSLFNYRKRLTTDPELAEIFNAKRAKVSEGWESEIPGAMRECISFIRQSAELGDKKNPDMLHAVAGALKMVSGVAVTWKVLDRKFGDNKPASQNQSAQPAPTPPLPN